MSQALNNMNTPKLVTGYLNTENVATLGSPLASPSGSIVQAYNGFLGTKMYLNTAEALALSSTAIGTLYAGTYQCVQTLLTSTATVARGTVLYWSDFDKNIVTPDVADATITGLIAGIALCAVTKGNYCYMQISGKCIVKFKATLTKVAASGDLVINDQAPTNTADVIADATGLTSVTAKGMIGVALEAPTNAGLKKVLLRFVGMS